MHFLSLFLIFFTFGIYAQRPTQVELVKANTLEFDKLLNKEVRRLIGDVVLKHDNTFMYCDSAYLYAETNNFDAFGEIFIEVSDSVRLWGKYLKYNGNSKMAELHQDVKMVDNQSTLTTEHLFYDMKNNIAFYDNNGHIISGQNTLTSSIGRYYSDSKFFFFKDSVVLINPEYVINSDTLKYNTVTEIAYFFGPTTIVSDDNEIYCEYGWYDTKNDLSEFSTKAYLKNENQILEGDSLFYDRNVGYGKAVGNVKITDLKEKIIISGQFGEYYEKTEISLVTDSASMIRIFENDSLFLHSDTLRSVLDSSGLKKILLAYYKVRFFKTDLQGVCDSIVFTFSDSITHMYGNPVIWSEENQITAEYIKILSKNSTIDKMYMQSSAFIISQQDSIKYNQIKGRDMVGYFENDELYKIDVSGNGQSVYYVTEDDGSITGVNTSESAELSIFLYDNQVDKITFRSRPEAVLYPIDEIPQDKSILRDFIWLDKIRPKDKVDIFFWVERPE
ncbi:MAG: OstA-like protein [Bacteroidales bacterium]|nr:OstA-like protein [Bacteroidales bacterium]